VHERSMSDMTNLQDQRPPQRQAKRLATLYVVILLLAAVAGVIVAATIILIPRVQQYGRDRQAWRDQGVVIMQDELDHLPHFGGSTASDPRKSTEPGRGPLIMVEYSLANPSTPGLCSSVHDYYQETAIAAGWALQSRSSGSKEIISTFQKSVSGYDIRLTIDCFVDQIHDGPGYTSDMHAPQPFF
jgi:hypothetical protein